MSILPFLAVTQVAAVAALLTRRERLLSFGIGVTGLVGATWTALLIVPGASALGGEPIVLGAYARLFLVVGSVAGLLLAVVGYATSWQRNVPAATLAALGWTGLGLALPDTGSAVAATVVAGLAGVLVTLVPPAGDRGIRVSARELRAVVAAGALALVAVAWVDVETAAGVDRPAGAVVGFALIAVAVSIGLRFGAVPFHAWAGRLSQAAPVTALPLLLAWAPAGFALVALGWIATTVAPFAAPGPSDAGSAGVGLGLERAVIVIIALFTLVGGAFAAWIQDEVEHVVGYLIAQDAGFVLLAFAAAGDAWGSARTFILVFAIAKTALAAWALALTATYRTNRIDDLDGWGRRSPFLFAGLVGVAVATIGWPGSAAWSARWSLAAGVAGDGLGLAILLAAMLSLASYVRIVRIGLRPPGATVSGAALVGLPWPAGAEAPTARSEAPTARSEAPTVLASRTLAGGVLAFAGGAGPAPDTRRDRVSGVLGGTVVERTANAGRSLRPLWRSYRLLTATVLAAVLAIVALATAGGAFGLVAAAREPAPPRPAIVLPPTPSPSPQPSLEPSAGADGTGSPSGSADSGSSAEPSGSGDSAGSQGGGAGPSGPPPPGTASPSPTPAPSSSPTAAPTTRATATPAATATPPATHHSYAVKSGDNLYAIAQRLRTTVSAILALNPTLKKDPTKLVVGQVIVVP